jgi:hypothetical protein
MALQRICRQKRFIADAEKEANDHIACFVRRSSSVGKIYTPTIKQQAPKIESAAPVTDRGSNGPI